MERTERTKLIRSYSQLVVRKVEEDGGAPKVGDFTVVGDGKVSIPQRKVPEDVLETRSVAAAVPQQPRVPIPESWLEFTVENTAHLTEDEIVQRLLFRDRFDPSKFGLMLFLPNGYSIAVQLINRMSGNFLLKSIGGDAMSTDDLMYILFPEDYFGKIIDETPTIEEMQEHVRVECMPLPPDFQKGDFEKRVTAIAQAMVDTYTDEARRDKFKGQLQNIVDLIFNKLPPNTENRVYWNNICVAIIGETVGEHDEYGEDGKKRLVELEGKFSTLKAAMEDRAAMKS